MLYTEENVRANIRNREGKRVYYLGKGDTLTSEARDYLQRERIEILPAEQARREETEVLGGGYIREKPEEMTHLNGQLLVRKTHPRIAFRGAVDSLEAEILLCGMRIPALREALEEALTLARALLAADVLERDLGEVRLGGMDGDALRKRSHFPQDFYGTPHFMPGFSDGEAILYLNSCRCKARQAELLAVDAFSNRDGKLLRRDVVQALNRLSSFLYLLMIQEKAKSR